MEWNDWLNLVFGIATLVGLGFGVLQYHRRKLETAQLSQAVIDWYHKAYEFRDMAKAYINGRVDTSNSEGRANQLADDIEAAGMRFTEAIEVTARRLNVEVSLRT